jgi:MinD-like ATPase involved in chromosome partitioning or flagellar assembly
VLYGLEPDRIHHSLNDYLWGRCEIAQAVHDVTDRLSPDTAGRVFLIPSSIRSGDIARVLRDGYDVQLLRHGFRSAIDALNLDHLLIDTHPGLNEETLLSLALSDSMLIILRPDQQDYQGTAVTVEIARRLELGRIFLILNKVPTAWDPGALAEKASATYGCEVAGVLPHCEDLMMLASAGIFVTRFPDHPVTRELAAIAARVWGA